MPGSRSLQSLRLEVAPHAVLFAAPHARIHVLEALLLSASEGMLATSA